MKFGLYRHFKGNIYRVVGVATNTETNESMVIYQETSGEYLLWARPLSMFMSEVDHDKYPNAKQKMRFEFIGKGDNNDVRSTRKNRTDRR